MTATERKKLQAQLKSVTNRIRELESKLAGLNRKKSQLEMVLSKDKRKKP